MSRTFQHVRLLPAMSVLENVAIGAHLRGGKGVAGASCTSSASRRRALLAEAARQLERVGLGEHLFDAAGSLPLGQQRIVEIARALAADPCLLLLDEPAAGLRLSGKAVPGRAAAPAARRGHGHPAGRARHGFRHGSGRPRRGDGVRREDRRGPARGSAGKIRRYSKPISVESSDERISSPIEVRRTCSRCDGSVRFLRQGRGAAPCFAQGARRARSLP